MNITITGNLGSGKTSVCRELKSLGFEVISAGDIFREVAAERGMTVLALNEAAKKDRSIDDLLDKRSSELGRRLDHTVFDSRLAWHFVKDSFKVFLLADTQQAARRVSAGAGRNAEAYADEQEALEGLQSRAALEQERFLKLYGINYYDGSNYDLVIESSAAAPAEIAKEILRNFQLYQMQPFRTKVELNLKCLYPLKTVRPSDIQSQETVCQAGQKGPKEPCSLCAAHPLEITAKNGYHYITHGHRHALAAVKAKKVFAEINAIYTGAADMQAAVPEAGSLHQFEEAGGFRYQANPGQLPEKPGYALEFPGYLCHAINPHHHTCPVSGQK